MKTIFIWSLFTSILLTMAACHHKDFCYDHPHGTIYVDVEYDDDNDDDDKAYLRDFVRATRLQVYHNLLSQPAMVTDIERKVNTLRLDPDYYNIIACNAGTQAISFQDRDIFSAYEAFTRSCDILEPLYGTRDVTSDIDLNNGEEVVIPAEPLWSVGATDVRCEFGDTIRLKAIPLHCRYSYEMRNIEGLQGVSRISSFITGMSGGASLSTNELSTSPVTVAVTARIGKDGKSIVGEFICFGDNPRIKTRHRMGLFIEMESGAKYKLLEGDHFDVTQQVVSAPNRRRVHIVIDGVKLPSANDNVAGFDVDVNPWGPGEDMDLDYDFGMSR